MARDITVVFDDTCSFCGRSIRLTRSLDWLGRFEYQGSSDAARLAGMGISRDECDREMKTVRNGRILGGFDAVTEIVSVLPLSFWLAPLLRLAPIRKLGHRGYKWVSARRTCRLV